MVPPSSRLAPGRRHSTKEVKTNERQDQYDLVEEELHVRLVGLRQALKIRCGIIGQLNGTALFDQPNEPTLEISHMRLGQALVSTDNEGEPIGKILGVRPKMVTHPGGDVVRFPNVGQPPVLALRIGSK